METQQEVLLTVSQEESPVHAWDLQNGTLLQSYRSASSHRNGTCLAERRFLVSARPSKKMVQMWTWSKDSIHSKSFTTEPIQVMACSRRGYCLVGGGKSGCMQAWHLDTGRLFRVWNAHFKAVSAIAFSKDDALLITGGEDGLVHVWNVMQLLDVESVADAAGNVPATATPLYSWSQHMLPVTSIAVGIEGDLSLVATASLDQTVNLWSLGDGGHLRTITFPGPLRAVVFDPLDLSIFVASDDTNIYEHTLVPRYPNQESFSSTESAFDSKVLKGHSAPVNGLTFNEDGSLLVSGSDDGLACVWDVYSRQCIRQFNHGTPITCVITLPKPKAMLLRGHRRGVKGETKCEIPMISLQKYAKWKREDLPPLDLETHPLMGLFHCNKRAKSNKKVANLNKQHKKEVD